MNIDRLLTQANETYTNKEYEKALELYNQVLLEDNTNYVALIRIEELKEKVKNQTNNSGKVSSEMNIFHETLLRLAKNAKEQQMYEKSINIYKQILDNDQKNLEALNSLAEIYEILGDNESKKKYKDLITNL
jgi:tetratricopeptide (TPR) repeat protein